MDGVVDGGPVDLLIAFDGTATGCRFGHHARQAKEDGFLIMALPLFEIYCAASFGMRKGRSSTLIWRMIPPKINCDFRGHALTQVQR